MPEQHVWDKFLRVSILVLKVSCLVPVLKAAGLGHNPSALKLRILQQYGLVKPL